MRIEMIKLGDKAKDRVTGLVGVVVAETFWLNGCHRLTIQPQELKDGKPVDTSCFDIEELELVEKNVVAKKPEDRVTNGPMPPTGGDR